MSSHPLPFPRVLVLAATGKTGRRVADRLEAAGVEVRRGSRAATPAFDWERPETWDAALAGMDAAYVVYTPDLAVPSAAADLTNFVASARRAGVRKLVLLSGRGEPEAQACERIVTDSGLAFTVVRAGWFNQNFSEGDFAGRVADGVIAMPHPDALEPFVDVDTKGMAGISAERVREIVLAANARGLDVSVHTDGSSTNRTTSSTSCRSWKQPPTIGPRSWSRGRSCRSRRP